MIMLWVYIVWFMAGEMGISPSGKAKMIFGRNLYDRCSTRSDLSRW